MRDEYNVEYAVYEKTAVGFQDGLQIASCDDADYAAQIVEMFNKKPMTPGRHYYVVTIDWTDTLTD